MPACAPSGCPGRPGLDPPSAPGGRWGEGRRSSPFVLGTLKNVKPHSKPFRRWGREGRGCSPSVLRWGPLEMGRGAGGDPSPTSNFPIGVGACGGPNLQKFRRLRRAKLQKFGACGGPYLNNSVRTCDYMYLQCNYNVLNYNVITMQLQCNC